MKPTNDTSLENEMVRMADWYSDAGLLFKEARARKDRDCKVCPEPILKGTLYERATVPNAGISAFVHADSIHKNCHGRYVEKYARA